MSRGVTIVMQGHSIASARRLLQGPLLFGALLTTQAHAAPAVSRGAEAPSAQPADDPPAAPEGRPADDSFPELPDELASDDSFPELPEEMSAETTDAEGASQPLGVHLGLQTEVWNQTLLNRVGPQDSDDLAATNVARLVLDFRREDSFGKGWRLGVSNRFDAAVDVVRGAGGTSYQGAWNSLRELWVGWQQSTSHGLFGASLGRINIRSGVGSGYNPSDFFKANAVRTSVSLDPVALRLNRLGAVMLELHYANQLGTLTAALVPRLASNSGAIGGGVQQEEPWYSLGLNRTNSSAALFLKWELQLTEIFSADVLAFLRDARDIRGAVNLSTVLHDTVVANAEWAVGHCIPLPSFAGPSAGSQVCAWGANNVTWTTPLGFDLTLEYQYAGDAFSGAAWRAWRRSEAGEALRDIAIVRAQAREPLVRHGWFARLGWRDPLAIRGLALSAMTQLNGYDGSAIAQLSVDWRAASDWLFGGNVIALLGANDTEFGMPPSRFSLGLYVGRSL